MIRGKAELLSACSSLVGMGKHHGVVHPGGDGAVPWICWSPAAVRAVQGDFQK